MTLRRATAGTAVLVVAFVLVLRDTAPTFVYDAAQYWRGNELVQTGRDPWLQGGLHARGVLTSFAYLPAAAGAAWLGLAPETSVLVMNALILALVGAVLVPALVGRVTELRIRHVVTSGALTTGLLSGFAPYPSMDLVSSVLILLAVLLLDLHRPWWIALGGILLGAAINLRPAHVAAAVAVLVVYAVLRRWRVIVVVAGVAVGLLPQVLYNAHRGLPFSAVPRDARLISEIQLFYSAYGVRYDTVAYLDQDPRQWYCNPEMARAVGDQVPTSTSELLQIFIQNLPTSAGLALEKLVGTLQWSWLTPYAGPGTPGWTVLGVLTLIVSVLGFAGLLVSLRQTDERPRATVVPLLVAVVVGTAVTLVGSSPETRFALPIVVAGIVGVTLLVTRLSELSQRARLVLGVAAAVSVLGFLLLGLAATSNPLPPGDLTTSGCLAT